MIYSIIIISYTPIFFSKFLKFFQLLSKFLSNLIQTFINI